MAFSSTAKSKIVERITSRLQNDAKPTPGQPPYKVIAAGRAKTIAANWKWVGQGLVSYYLVAVDSARHLNQPSEAEPYNLLPCRLEDHTWEGGGKRVVPPPGAKRVFITVWAVVDLGWAKVYGPPRHSGPVAVG
jgi:hypothetical protein